MALKSTASAAASTFTPRKHYCETLAVDSNLVEDGGDDEELLVEGDPHPHEIATDPTMRCRYPSKHCIRQRTIKKTGALHSMCTFHRAKANRNQRRLEKRKRLLKDEERMRRQNDQQRQMQQPRHLQPLRYSSPPATVMLPPVVSSDGFFSYGTETQCPPMADATPPFSYQSPRDVDMHSSHLEPYRSPVPLFIEDLEELSALVDVSVMDVQVSHACDHHEATHFRIV